jgi:hypothetical protein
MWWFYTVILGMAFGRVLQELAVTMRDWRHGTRQPFAPAMLWQAFLLVLIVQVWLAVKYAVHTKEISVLGLLAFLTVPSGILVMSFLLPQSDPDPQHDPEVAFNRVRPMFFGVLIGILAINLLHTFLIGQRGLDLDLLFQCLLAAGGLFGLFLRRTRADIAMARGDDRDCVRLHRHRVLDGRGGWPRGLVKPSRAGLGMLGTGPAVDFADR